jgi:alanyl-tRNA synthetase
MYEADRLLTENLTKIHKVALICAAVSSKSKESLMEMSDILKERMKSGVVVLATIYEDKPFFIASATHDVVALGIHCGKLIKQVASIAGGSGGGKPDMAQAGAKENAKVADALQSVPDLLIAMLKK